MCGISNFTVSAERHLTNSLLDYTVILDPAFSKAVSFLL
jgi:hypothetical protein